MTYRGLNLPISQDYVDTLICPYNPTSNPSTSGSWDELQHYNCCRSLAKLHLIYNIEAASEAEIRKINIYFHNFVPLHCIVIQNISTQNPPNIRSPNKDENPHPIKSFAELPLFSILKILSLFKCYIKFRFSIRNKLSFRYFYYYHFF